MSIYSSGEESTVKKAVVTGATGFLGSNLVEGLISRGYFVYAIVRPESANVDRLKGLTNVEIIEYDIQNTTGEMKELIVDKCDYFFHLAWPGDFNDFDEQMENVNCSLSALRSAKSLGCKRFLCTGSQAEYAITEDVITEESLVVPRGPYGAAKVATCFSSRILAEEIGIDWIWGRVFSVYGRNDLDKHMIPKLITTLKSGKTMEMSSCEQYWDFLNVKDFVECFVLLAEKGKTGEIYNIADGRSRKLKEYIDIVTGKIGYGTIKLGTHAEPFVSLRPDISKLKRDTGWEPKISFEDGIEELLKRQ